MTFEESLQKCMHYLHEHGRSEATIKHYRHDLQQFARWFEQTNGCQPTPEAITPAKVKEYCSHMQNVKDYKPSTINRRLYALRALCRWAVETGLIATDPTAGIKEIKQQRPGPKVLDRLEIYRVIQALEDRLQWALSYKGSLSGHAARAKRDMAIVMLLLHTGLRVSELAGLQLSDIEMSKRTGNLTVAHNRNKRRKVPLNTDARKALRRWLAARPEVESKALFLGRGSVPLSVRGVQKVLADLGKRAQVENLHPHILRHTFATRYLEAHPGDLVGLTTILGQKSLETMRIYTAPNSAELPDKVEKLALNEEENDNHKRGKPRYADAGCSAEMAAYFRRPG
jgi:site-specific recombinase XerD